MRRFCLIFALIFLSLNLPAKTDKDPEIVVRNKMLAISKDLGVTCTYCHEAQNFKDTKMKTYGVAKEHIRITALLNSEQGFHGKPTVSCFTCHHGAAKFQNQAP